MIQQLIKNENSKKIINFLKKEIKSLSYILKTDAEYDRKILALTRKLNRKEISKSEYETELAKIQKWLSEKQSHHYYKDNIFDANKETLTVLIIVYNRFRRGDRRPHTGSVESDKQWLYKNNYQFNKIKSYIEEHFGIIVSRDENSDVNVVS